MQQPPCRDQILGAAQVEAGEFSEAVHPVAHRVRVHGKPLGGIAYLLIAVEVDPRGLGDVLVRPARAVKGVQVTSNEASRDLRAGQHQGPWPELRQPYDAGLAEPFGGVQGQHRLGERGMELIERDRRAGRDEMTREMVGCLRGDEAETGADLGEK